VRPSPERARTDAAAVARIARGSIYLDRELCERYLPGVTAVAPLVRAGRALLLPLRGPAAGGLLLKIRNGRGDCVVHADDFLAGLGLGSEAEREVAVHWESESAGLVLEGLSGPAPCATAN
jgi:hypothetical protein